MAIVGDIHGVGPDLRHGRSSDVTELGGEVRGGAAGLGGPGQAAAVRERH